MMHENPPWEQFKAELAARGVTMRWMWEARRDGRKPQWGLGIRGRAHRPADVGMVAFTGDGFQPSILVAIVIDYGGKDGFGLFTEAQTNSIRADADAIAGIEPTKEQDGFIAGSRYERNAGA